jgi:hypothetical protein
MESEDLLRMISRPLFAARAEERVYVYHIEADRIGG